MPHPTGNFKGMGISREYQQHLFDPYTQANASISRRFGGTGLGLSICKRIAELMHGALWCESELGKGSTFHLSIPCTPARNIYCPQEQAVVTAEPLDGAAECSILVAEDNEINVEVLRAMQNWQRMVLFIKKAVRSINCFGLYIQFALRKRKA